MKLLFVIVISIQVIFAAKVYDLSHPITPKMPSLSRSRYMFNQSGFMNQSMFENVTNVRLLDQIFCSLETSGTHLAAPFILNKANWKLHEITARRLVAPLVVLHTTESQGIEIQHLRHWERKHGTIKKGSVVVMDSGWSVRWNTSIEQYLGMDAYNQKPNYPGFSLDACKYLISRSVVGVGVDTLTVDGSNYNRPCLKELADNDVYILNNLNILRDLPNSGALIFVGALNMLNAAGSPVRVLAYYDDKTCSSDQLTSSIWLYLALFWFCSFITAFY